MNNIFGNSVAAYYLTLLLLFLTGLAFGSFANVLIYRLPRELSPVLPRSFCPACGKHILWYDNIPVISFLLLRGRCRFCSQRIPMRYPAVEFLSAVFFTAPAYIWGFTFYSTEITILLYFSMIITVIDIGHRIIPDELNLFLFLFGVFIPEAGQPYLHCVIFSAAAAATAGLILFIIAVLASKIFKQEAMGMGDVKLIAALAAFTGLNSIFWLIFISSLAGSVIGIAIKIIKRSKGYTLIAFGPYLCFAALFYKLFSSHLPRLFY